VCKTRVHVDALKGIDNVDVGLTIPADTVVKLFAIFHFVPLWPFKASYLITFLYSLLTEFRRLQSWIPFNNGLGQC
jgi:hypothetical protein